MLGFLGRVGLQFYSTTSLWTPALLFAAGEPGVWYDPSDFSTMFTDAAGTTPVTAVEQPVGLLLDKSKGLALGAELITNGDFSSGTGWSTFGTGSSIGSGVLTINNAGVSGGALQVAISSGKWYRVSLTATVRSGIGRVVLGSYSLDVTTKTFSASGTYTWYLQSLGPNVVIERHAGTPDFDVDNISVRELPGNHASQSTAASRPVLSARVNLLTYSEQFDNAAWTKSGLLAFGSGSTANATVAPDGATTADLITENTASSRHEVVQSASPALVGATAYVFSFYAKEPPSNSRRYVQVFSTGTDSTWHANFDLNAGVVSGIGTNGTATITPVGNGWFRCVWNFTSAASPGGSFLYISLLSSGTAARAASYTGDGTSGLYIWGADLRVTNVGAGLPAYQRVAAATDYDTTGFPFFLAFNGSTGSRWMVSSTITPGTDKAQVFAGVRKLSDAAQGIVSELSATIASNNGSFALTAPNSAAANYNFSSKGTTQTDSTVLSYTAPITNVLAGLGDIAGASNLFRVNGAQVGSALTTQGTGNYLAYPLYIGARAGTSLYYDGNLYELIVRFGPNLSEATIDQTEVWVGDKTGLNLSYATQQTIFDRFNATVLNRLSDIILQRY